MAEIVLQIQIDADLKNAAEKIYNSMGLNFSDAVKLFAKKSVELGTAPFIISTEKKSAFGALSKYANKNLIPLENTAWQNSAAEKHCNK